MSDGTQVDVQDIYERYVRDLRRFALYLSGDPAAADDLTSEAFVRLWTARGEIRAPTVKAYLFTIVRNLFATSRRRDRSVPLDEATPDPSDRIEAPLLQRSEADQARRLLARLSPEDRTALLMRADEVPYEDIAAAFAITVTAAKVRVHRARLKMAALRDEDTQRRIAHVDQ